MNYWWCKRDPNINMKEILSLGPHWSDTAYHMEDTDSEEYGPLDPKRMILKFNNVDDGTVTNFVSILYPCTCDQMTFVAMRDFFDQAIVYDVKIDDKPHYQVCAKNYYDLIDLPNCENKFTRSGTPHRFKKLAIKSLPPEGTHFFSLAKPTSIRWAAIVSDDFKDRYERLGLTGLAFNKVDCH